MRPNQHNNNNNNKNRNRNRNRNRTGYSSNTGGGGGGNGANKVLDSNGPDVKLRGTAQTIAEKYMQLGRDAHSSGDTVMAESYYQFADHYYRVWLAAQPAGQPIQFSRRMGGEDEYEDDAQDSAASDGEDETPSPESESSDASDSNGTAEANGQQAGENVQPRQNRPRDNNQNRDNTQNRDNNGNGRERFQRRWPRRFDRNAPEGAPQAEGEVPGQDRAEPQQERVERSEPVERVERQARAAETVDPGNWEAPSFLTRPTPLIAEEGVVEPSPRPRGRRPARVAAPPADEPAAE